MNRQSIIKKIQALLSKTVDAGCTEGEALAAAKKAGQLMDEHNLSMSEIEVREAKCATVDHQMSATKHAVFYCAGAIAAYCDCICWRQGKTLKFFGLPADAEIAGFLADLCMHAMNREWKQHLAKCRAVGWPTTAKHKSDFLRAMAARLSRRFREMIMARKATAATSSGTALVVVKNAVVQEQFSALALEMHTMRVRRRQIDPIAHNAGIAAGDRVNITTGITAAKHPQINA